MKKITAFLRLFLRTLIHPSYLATLLNHYTGRLYQVNDDNYHLDAAISWINHSIDRNDGKGSSGIYTFHHGWLEPYPETSGYIIPTLISYSRLTNHVEYVERAIKLSDWEIDLQLSSGAIRGGVGINAYPIVFNTGQVMIGWLAMYNHSKDAKYLEAAERSAQWLVQIMDEDGKWAKNTYNNLPHAYNIRVTWPLLETGLITKNELFVKAAEKNIKWVLANSKDNGWVDHMGFTTNETPFTHTIAYTIRGLIECGVLLEDNKIKKQTLDLAFKAADSVRKSYEFHQHKRKIRGMLPGQLDHSWSSDSNYSCLTGNAQFAIIWLKLYQLTGNVSFLNSSIQIMEQLKSTQNLKTFNKGIRGGVPGSYPTWGDYIHFGYPNWAAKFFADALILKREILTQ